MVKGADKKLVSTNALEALADYNAYRDVANNWPTGGDDNAWNEYKQKCETAYKTYMSHRLLDLDGDECSVVVTKKNGKVASVEIPTFKWSKLTGSRIGESNDVRVVKGNGNGINAKIGYKKLPKDAWEVSENGAIKLDKSTTYLYIAEGADYFVVAD